MIRDFSHASEEELLTLVTQIKGEQICAVTDWFGDRWYDFRDLIGTIEIDSYLDRINDYHKIVLDKNNTAEDDIKRIFQNVRDVDSRYSVRFVACQNRLVEYNRLIKTISDIILPENGLFAADKIESIFSGALEEFTQANELLKKISGNGANAEDFNDLDKEQIEQILLNMAQSLSSLMPNVKIGEKLEIPIGPDLTFYYEVEKMVNGECDIDLNLIAEEQKIKIKNLAVSSELGDILAIGGEVDTEGKVSISSENSEVSFNFDGTSEGSASVKVGNDTYTIKTTVNLESLTVEESVETEFEKGSVTTKIGIEKKNNQYKPLPVPVYEESSEPIHIPEFEVDWETVVVVSGVLIFAAGILLAPATGGGSLVLCAV